MYGNGFRNGAAPHCDILYRTSEKPGGPGARATRSLHSVFYLFRVYYLEFSPNIIQAVKVNLAGTLNEANEVGKVYNIDGAANAVILSS